jgi:hypothetical protein
LEEKFTTVLRGTGWTYSLDIYNTGWGQMFLEGEPESGQLVATRCRNELGIETITDMWISLHDIIDEAPTNVQNIVDRYDEKNIDMWPMLDTRVWLRMERGGTVF